MYIYISKGAKGVLRTVLGGKETLRIDSHGEQHVEGEVEEPPVGPAREGGHVCGDLGGADGGTVVQQCGYAHDIEGDITRVVQQHNHRAYQRNRQKVCIVLLCLVLLRNHVNYSHLSSRSPSSSCTRTAPLCSDDAPPF